jgi:hypothetical protein
VLFMLPAAVAAGSCALESFEHVDAAPTNGYVSRGFGAPKDAGMPER